ncbi:MAG: hypothetical protein IID41_00440 [Planctomycetes bacterium]|nr:hypothetical protein [Planctomycetota bacterium]
MLTVHIDFDERTASVYASKGDGLIGAEVCILNWNAMLNVGGDLGGRAARDRVLVEDESEMFCECGSGKWIGECECEYS